MVIFLRPGTEGTPLSSRLLLTVMIQFSALQNIAFIIQHLNSLNASTSHTNLLYYFATSSIIICISPVLSVIFQTYTCSSLQRISLNNNNKVISGGKCSLLTCSFLRTVTVFALSVCKFQSSQSLVTK